MRTISFSGSLIKSMWMGHRLEKRSVLFTDTAVLAGIRQEHQLPTTKQATIEVTFKENEKIAFVGGTTTDDINGKVRLIGYKDLKKQDILIVRDWPLNQNTLWRWLCLGRIAWFLITSYSRKQVMNCRWVRFHDGVSVPEDGNHHDRWLRLHDSLVQTSDDYCPTPWPIKHSMRMLTKIMHMKELEEREVLCLMVWRMLPTQKWNIKRNCEDFRFMFWEEVYPSSPSKPGPLSSIKGNYWYVLLERWVYQRKYQPHTPPPW